MDGWTSASSLGVQTWKLQKGQHLAALTVRKVSAGIELVLTVDGQLERSKLYRAEDQRELATELADALEQTRRSFETKGWA
jgi:hypothetical protein